MIAIENVPPTVRMPTAVMVQPIHVITDDATERWPQASFATDEEVFVCHHAGVYFRGQIVLILSTLHGETVYAVRVGRSMLIKTREELTK